MSDRRVDARGPLASLAAAFETELGRLGYKAGAANKQLGLLDDLSPWLAIEGIALAELTSERVVEFIGGRRREGRPRFVSLKGMGTMLGFLRDAGVVPEPCRPTPVSPTEVLLERYWRFLVVDRGLADAVVAQYETGARLFADFAGDSGLALLTRTAPAPGDRCPHRRGRPRHRR